jgi:hypothetical protein
MVHVFSSAAPDDGAAIMKVMTHTTMKGKE